mgnify:CR=1 FL=1
MLTGDSTPRHTYLSVTALLPAGSSLVALEGNPYVIRRYETNLGDILADAATETAMGFLKDVGSTPLVTIVNAGAVRSSLPAVGAAGLPSSTLSPAVTCIHS